MAAKPNVAELVARMPEVDKPKPDAEPKPGETGKFTGPDPAAAEKTFASILSGGRESVLELLALVKAPGDDGFENYKAAYVVHGLAVLAGRPGREPDRTMLAEALCAQLANAQHSKQARAFFIQEIQTCGRRECVTALAPLVTDDELGDPALRSLLSIRDGAADALRTQCATASGRTRLGLIHALGRLGDTTSIAFLRGLLGDAEASTRLAAAWSLATQADGGASELLLRLANSLSGWGRVQADDCVLLLAEKLAASGKKAQAKQLYERLRDARTEADDAQVRAAAERGLKGLQ